jgi:DNA-binding transcriptional MerR regulator
MSFVAKKLYYKIREVCEIVGVEAHVLRFWETEFPALSPPKTKTGQRIYRPKDIELLLQIRKLLYEEGFTIAGARKKLSMAVPTKPGKARGKTGAPADAPERAAPPQKSQAPIPKEAAKSSERLRKVKDELRNILTLLDRE